MTDREKAIVMAHTGICMLAGEKLDVFYQYLAELYGRPVYTHEWVTLDIKEKSKPDFLQLCKEEEPERKKGKWIYYPKASSSVTSTAVHLYPVCSECGCEHPIANYCPNCGARMEEGGE